MRDGERRTKNEEREREKQARIKDRESERVQMNELKEKQRVEAQRRRDDQRHALAAMREKRQQQIDHVKEARRLQLDRHRDEERRIKDQQRTAKMLAGRETMVDDLELMEIEGCSKGPLAHKAWVEVLERAVPNPALATDLIEGGEGAISDGRARLEAHYVSDALEVLEFFSYFGEHLGCKCLNWYDFEEALV